MEETATEPQPSTDASNTVSNSNNNSNNNSTDTVTAEKAVPVSSSSSPPPKPPQTENESDGKEPSGDVEKSTEPFKVTITDENDDDDENEPNTTNEEEEEETKEVKLSSSLSSPPLSSSSSQPAHPIEEQSHESTNSKEEYDDNKGGLIKYKEGDVYKHEYTGFELNPPPGWFLSAEDKTISVFTSEDKSGNDSDGDDDNDDNSSECAQLNVVTQQVGPDMTLQDFTAVSKAQLEDSAGVPVHLRNEALGGLPGVRCEYMVANAYSSSSSSSNGSDDTRGVYQAWCLYRGVAFILTFTAPIAKYKELFSAAKKAIESFTLEHATVSFQNFYSTVFLYRRKLPPGMCAAIYLPATWAASQEVKKSTFFPEKDPQEIARFEFNGKLDEDPDSLPLCMRLCVTADRLPVGVALEQYTDMVYRQLCMMRAQSVSLLRGKFEIGGLPADMCIFESSDVPREGTRFFHMWTVKDRRAYVLALAIASPDPNERRPFEMFARIAANLTFDNNINNNNNSNNNNNNNSSGNNNNNTVITANNGGAKTAARKLAVYENFEKRFGICFPESFSGKDNYMGNTVSFFSGEAMAAAAAAAASDVTNTTLNVIFEELDGTSDVTLDRLCETLKSQIDGQDSCRIVNEIMTDYKILGAPVKCISYILGVDSECLKFVQYAAISRENSCAVIISFGAEESRFEAEFRKFGVEKCINSVYVF